VNISASSVAVSEVTRKSLISPVPLKRKPQLNLSHEDLVDFKERIGITSSKSRISRVQSLTDGLNNDESTAVFGLSRTRSFNTGLDDVGRSSATTLRRVPSVDEILESVKNLRAKQNMVKSATKSDVTAKRNKKSQAPNVPISTSVGTYKSISDSDHLYENYNGANNDTFYENINNETSTMSLYDEPRKLEYTGTVVTPKDSETQYENLSTMEPTYMNVSDESNLYENVQHTEQCGVQYDVPRPVTHIYDAQKVRYGDVM